MPQSPFSASCIFHQSPPSPIAGPCIGRWGREGINRESKEGAAGVVGIRRESNSAAAEGIPLETEIP
jgi:hypothetical protein